ncbi:MAG: HEAT repeat domain-containing protein [Candidatus Acidiferrales bacterium]
MRLDANSHTNDNRGQSCSKWQPLLVLLAAGDEMEPVQQAELAGHLACCADCSAALDRERELLVLLAAHRQEPDAVLLASCRASLEDALDHEEERGWLRRTVGTLLPSNWLSPRPAWSAALLLMIGFSMGILGPRLLRNPAPAVSPIAVTGSAEPADNANSGSTTSTPVDSPAGTLDLRTADVAGINVFPSSGENLPQVELQMRAQQPITVQGTVDNDDVKRVLLYVLHHSERFDSDVRLNAVDLLRTRNNDPEVRSALCQAVHTDRNAAVRLKALEALNGAEPQEIIRETLVDALVDDHNPGVRIEAVNSLRQMAEHGQVVADPHILAVLRDRMQNDPSTYIRLQSAGAIRDLVPRTER